MARDKEEITRPEIDTPLSLWNFTEEENMLRETGRSAVHGPRFAFVIGDHIACWLGSPIRASQPGTANGT